MKELQEKLQKKQRRNQKKTIQTYSTPLTIDVEKRVEEILKEAEKEFFSEIGEYLNKDLVDLCNINNELYKGFIYFYDTIQKMWSDLKSETKGISRYFKENKAKIKQCNLKEPCYMAEDADFFQAILFFEKNSDCFDCKTDSKNDMEIELRKSIPNQRYIKYIVDFGFYVRIAIELVKVHSDFIYITKDKILAVLKICIKSIKEHIKKSSNAHEQQIPCMTRLIEMEHSLEKLRWCAESKRPWDEILAEVFITTEIISSAFKS